MFDEERHLASTAIPKQEVFNRLFLGEYVHKAEMTSTIKAFSPSGRPKRLPRTPENIKRYAKFYESFARRKRPNKKGSSKKQIALELEQIPDVESERDSVSESVTSSEENKQTDIAKPEKLGQDDAGTPASPMDDSSQTQRPGSQITPSNYAKKRRLIVNKK